MRQNEFIPHEPEGPLYTSEITDDTAAQKKKKPKPKATKTESVQRKKLTAPFRFLNQKDSFLPLALYLPWVLYLFSLRLYPIL